MNGRTDINLKNRYSFLQTRTLKASSFHSELNHTSNTNKPIDDLSEWLKNDFEIDEMFGCFLFHPEVKRWTKSIIFEY
jgi:hypothetical protein